MDLVAEGRLVEALVALRQHVARDVGLVEQLERTNGEVVGEHVTLEGLVAVAVRLDAHQQQHVLQVKRVSVMRRQKRDMCATGSHSTTQQKHDIIWSFAVAKQ